MQRWGLAAIALMGSAGMAAAQTRPVPDPSQAAYQSGHSDRIAWERWIDGLTGDAHDGAAFWAGQRSLPHPQGCDQTGQSADWKSGCQQAQAKLAPIDVRRRAEPIYRSGWNAPIDEAIAEPRPPQLFHVDHDAYGCLNPQSATALANTQDPRSNDPSWINYFVMDGHCMMVTPRSQWRLISRQGDLAYMAYAGTAAPAVSFYLPSNDLIEISGSEVLSTPAPPASTSDQASTDGASASQASPPTDSSPTNGASPPPSTSPLNTNTDGSGSPTATGDQIDSPPAPPVQTITPPRADQNPDAEPPSAEATPDFNLLKTIGGFAFAIIVVIGTIKWLRARYEERRKRMAFAIALAEIDRQAGRLRVRRMQLVQPDYYGTVDIRPWEKECGMFIQTRIVPQVSSAGYSDILENMNIAILAAIERAADRPIEASEYYPYISTPEIFSPSMDPIHYEQHCALLLQKAGWKTRMTAVTGDQGADILADKGGRTLVVQCKLYSSPVGNDAVQQAFAAQTFQRAHIAMVVSNAGFTRSARQLAGTTGVYLLHHEELVAFGGEAERVQI